MELTLTILDEIWDDNLRNYIHTEFENMMLNDDSVRDLLDHVPTAMCQPVNKDFIKQVICAIFAYKISTINDSYGFHDSIDSTKAYNNFKSYLQNSSQNTNAIQEAQNIYHTLFPTYATHPQNGICFHDFLQKDRDSWKQQFQEYLKSNSWITQLWAKYAISSDLFCHCASLSLYKLARLESDDPPSDTRPSLAVSDIVQHWESTMKKMPIGTWKELKNLSWILKQQFTLVYGFFTFDREGDRLGTILGDNITRWQAGYRTKTQSSITTGYASDVTLEIHGEPILNWLQTTGKIYFTHPDKVYNERRHSVNECCFLAGTKITKEDMSEVPIEELKPHDRILNAFGSSALQTDMKVYTTLQKGISLYGMMLETNDGTVETIPPFVTGGHLFMTPDGWKAILPSIAQEENAFRHPLPLTQGDILYRICPNGQYETVKIQKILSRPSYEGEIVYDVHLVEGQANYHANSFLVAFNYPVYTPQRIWQSFSANFPNQPKVHQTIHALLQEMDEWMADYYKGAWSYDNTIQSK